MLKVECLKNVNGIRLTAKMYKIFHKFEDMSTIFPSSISSPFRNLKYRHPVKHLYPRYRETLKQ